MFTLPDALAPLRAYRQFIVYQLVPSATRPGKTDKFPIDWRTMRKHDAHDPAIWLTVEEAALYAESFGPDYGVGFVFTEADPFFFIDIDGCIHDEAESETALALRTRFPGAATEISSSGKGLHIIAQGVAPRPRKTRYDPWFELYTEAQFCALTGIGAQGNAETDHSSALACLVAEYLTPDATTHIDWTNTPRADWKGPTDDNDLIQRASRLRATQIFGGKVPFVALFNADAGELSAAWPQDGGYNASAADASLAQALAFWTGNDCERILRIMRMSKLDRSKWEREDYMRRTILGVCSRQQIVCTDKDDAPAIRTITVATNTEHETFITGEKQKQVFHGCVYIEGKHRALVPGGKLLKMEQFNARFGGYTFSMDAENSKVTDKAWDAFINSKVVTFPRADNVTFRPDLEPVDIVEDGGERLANIWWPIDTPQIDGDPSPFLGHMVKLFPDERDRTILLSFMAAMVQYPGAKFQWAPLIQGVEGNGKTFIVTAMRKAIGYRYSHLPNSSDLVGNGGKFTGWLEGKLFIGIEEIYSGDRRELIEVLKPLITNDGVEIQAKGQDQYTGENRANLIACSNHKDAVPKTTNDRRWGIFFCAQQEKEDLARDGFDRDYMPGLWKWGKAGGFAIINHYLRKFAIPKEYDPSGEMHRAPETSSTADAISVSLGAIEQEIQEAIEQGEPGFAGGWVSSMQVDKLLRRLNAERRVPPKKRKELLKALGYVPHPHLHDGRVNNPVEPDNGKTRLYIREGHINGNFALPKDIASAYEKAQLPLLTNSAVRVRG